MNLVLALCLFSTVVAQAAPLTPAEKKSFKSNLIAVSSKLKRLTDEQVDLIAELQGGPLITSELIAFVLAFGGNSEAMTKELQNLVSERAKVAQGHSGEIIEAWIALPGMESVARTYRRLIADRWTVDLTNQNIKLRSGKSASGLMTPDDKRVQVAIGLTDEPPVLVFAEEVLHAADWRLFQQNQDAVDKYLRTLIAESSISGLDRMNQMERYSWQMNHAIQAAAKEVSDETLQQARAYLFESSAFLEKMAIYQKLHAEQLIAPSEMWDMVLASSNPRETVNLVLAELRFAHLPTKLTAAIGATSMADILAANGLSSNDVPGLTAKLSPPPPPTWSTIEEFKASLPEAIRSDLSYIRIYEDSQIRFFVRNLSESDIHQLGAYITRPELAWNPYRMEDRLRSSNDRWATEVYHHFELICSALVEYDIEHGTNFTAQYGFKMLSLLRADKGMRDYDALFDILRKRFKSADATFEMAEAFLTAIWNSNAAGGVLHNPNAAHGLAQVLKIYSQGILEGKHPTFTPAQVELLLDAASRYFLAQGQTNREGSSYLDISHAHGFNKIGLDFMTSIHNEAGIRVFEARTLDTQAKLDGAAQRAREERQMRDPTPANYEKTKLPDAAAFVIVTAIRAREARMDVSASANQRTSRIRSLWSTCNRMLMNLKPGKSEKPK